MATKRMSNVYNNTYSFSEDSDYSEEDNARKYNNSSSSSKLPFQLPVTTRSRNGRKLRHVSSSCDENVFVANQQNPKYAGRSGRVHSSNSNSKNAILARENRLKKKMYLNGLENQITSLKNENKNMKMTLGTQSNYITDLQAEIEYLRNILANSKEISILIKSIRSSTGLPVNTSLNKFAERDCPLPNRQVPIAKKTAGPFDNSSVDLGMNISTPPTSISSLSPPHTDEYPLVPFTDMMPYLSDDDFPIAFNDVGLSPFMEFDDFQPTTDETTSVPHTPETKDCQESACLDHNYSTKEHLEVDTKSSNYGVCLHISNKKISLEFCSKCNETAISNWDAVV